MRRNMPIGMAAALVSFVLLMLSGVGAQAQSAGWTAQPVQPLASSQAGFDWIQPSSSGVVFTNQLPVDRYITNQIYLNGAGVALGDVDGDGLTDIYLCGIQNDNVLFRNLGGWRFADVTAEAGVACRGLASSGAVFADLDGDRDLDLAVNSVGQGTHIFLNDGRARFKAKTPPGGLNTGRAGSSFAIADVDGDTDLDLYVANYRTDTIRDMPDTRLQYRSVGGRMVVISVDGRAATEPDLVGRFTLADDGTIVENGEADVLYLNDGKAGFSPLSFTDGRFLDESGAALTSPPYDWGLSAMFRDINGDSAPDLYVCNDFVSPDRFWINDGKGGFRAIAPLGLRHTSIFSMGADFGDLNRDGFDDLVVSDMMMQGHSSRQLRIGDVPPVFHGIGVIEDRPQYSANTVSLNRGDGTFAEVAWYGDAEASGWTWCPVLIDVDLDGYEDLIFPTGHERDMMNGDVIQRAEVLKAQRRMSRREQLELRTMFRRFDTPNVAFRNQGDLTFGDYSEQWGFTAREVSQGIALGDLDNDGDLDVVVNNLNGCAGLYRNRSAAGRVGVRLEGAEGNAQGIGARISLRGGAVPVQSQEMISGGRYLSGDDAIRVFAAPSDAEDMVLEVAWRSGKRSVVEPVRANHIYVIRERAATGPPDKPAQDSLEEPYYEVVEDFDHRHVETPYDDFLRQPLLPVRLSQPGPGVGWCDVNDDGWEDLVIGGGRGGSIALFQNDGRGRLLRHNAPFLDRPLPRDLTGVLGVGPTLLAGSSNYEDGVLQGGALKIFDVGRQAAGESVLGFSSSTGPIAMSDIDLDGDLDLFVGGRSVAGHYPAPAESQLLRNEGGRFVAAHKWADLGVVSGAVFSDLDVDGDPDLVVSCDWGPIRVLLNDSGEFREATASWGLEDYKGRWNGVATGDLNNDGRPDVIVGNWGLNSSCRASRQSPYRIYYGDLDGDRRIEVIEARYEPELSGEVPQRGFRPVGMALPWVREKLETYEAYSQSTLADIYGDRLNGVPYVEVTTLASMVFLNEGQSFRGRDLPAEAQWTPARGVCVGDFDGDGNEDVFLSQNFFAVASDAWRQDAGRGLWLRGDGKGDLKSVSGQESGVQVYGEQRGCALGDFNRDGRIDLVVSQNGAETRLFRNRKAEAGIRVRLKGPSGNIHGFGASLRLKVGDRLGPRREVQAGSGHLSQNSPVTVLSGLVPGAPASVQVQWLADPSFEVSVPPDTVEIVVDLSNRR